MRKSNFTILRCLVIGCITSASFTFGLPQTWGQTAFVEPKTPGIFYLLDAQGNEKELEYKAIKASTIAVAVEGAQSPMRVTDGGSLKFLVRLPTDLDLRSALPTISFDEFESKNGWRAVEFVAFAHPPRLKRPPMAVIPFDSIGAGTSSMVLSPKTPLQAGEYCLGIGKGTKDAYCFGVDDSAAASATSQGASSNGASAPMTDADVIKMVTAGLGPEVIIGAIRQSPEHKFDLSIDGLIALKKDKVPDSVVAAMQQPAGGANTASEQRAPSTDSSPSQFSGPVPTPPDESVFYYVNSSGKLGKLEHLTADRILEAELSHRQQTGWKVFGARSGTRFTNGAVTIVVKLYGKVLIFDAGNEANIRFRRWEPTTGARETWYSSRPPNRYRQKVMEQGEFEFTAAKVGENTYKITPNEPLIPGEYCISTGQFHSQYCFGIDPSR